MKNYFCRMALISCAALFLAGIPALARSGHYKTVQVQILYPSLVSNGTHLTPGTYNVEVAENTKSPEVMFYRHNKLVAQAQAQLVNTSTKSSQTELHYSTEGGQHVLTQLDLRGWMGKVMFNGPGSAGSGS